MREEPTLQIDAWLELNELNLELANSLEMLAPFGAGNPSLTLASRDVTMKSVSTIGKTKEHLRLNIEDENGNVQSILWWGGAGEELPEQAANLTLPIPCAHPLFADRNKSLCSLKNSESLKKSLLRSQNCESRNSRFALATFHPSILQPSILIWAEGSDKSKGKSRFELHQADEFAIYTTPPSPAELRKALEIVKPKTISIFAIPPAEEKPDDFLNRLGRLMQICDQSTRRKSDCPRVGSGNGFTRERNSDRVGMAGGGRSTLGKY